MAYTDQNILELFDADREAGTAALLKTYTGLLWSICARRLDDEEDIKECVNDVFVEFVMKRERFDPAAGTLKQYLCTIADRRAIDLQRKNWRRNKSEIAAQQNKVSAQEASEFYGLSKEDLETALSRLNPASEQIIRMKYYEGMTYQEIAARLGVNYETVRKRGQRGLKELWRLLIVLLLLAALAACAVKLYRQFFFVERAGFNWDMEQTIYYLDSAPPTQTADGITYFFSDARWRDEKLYLRLECVWDRDPGVQVAEQDRIVDHYIRHLQLDGVPASGMGHQVVFTATPEGMIAEIECPWQLAGGETAALTVTLAGVPEGDTQINDGYTMEGPNPVYTLSLVPAVPRENLEELGTVSQIGDFVFLVKSGHSDGAVTSLSLYELKETELPYSFSPLLIRHYLWPYGREADQVTLTDSVGNQYFAVDISGSSLMSLDEVRVTFPGVLPGKYRLNIPYICLTGDQSTEAVELPLPKTDREPLALDMDVLFPDGSGLRLTGVTRTWVASGTWIEVGQGERIMATEDQWQYELEWDPISLEKLVPCAAQCTIEAPVNGGVTVAGQQILLNIQDGEAPDSLQLRFSSPVYVLEQAVSLAVTVSD